MTGLLLLATVLATPAQLPSDTVRYQVSFPNAAHHEAEVTVTFANVPPGPLQVRMSRSSPGRYALHEFIKNVYGVRAEDSRGRPLEVDQRDPYGWRVLAGRDGLVKFSYTLYGDRVDGTYMAVDRSHAHLNMPATFAWAAGFQQHPIRITFETDPAWKIATQLEPTHDSASYAAPDLQYFMDSPTELSNHAVRSWTVDDGQREQTVRLVVHHLGTADEVDRYADLVRRVVDEEWPIYGEMPQFDHGSYTFIADYLPWASGDGMEHRNSTILTSSGNLADNAIGLLGTVSHEFFHAWNVERIRPRGIEPFDFTQANMTGELWFAEGFTSYYDDLFIHRAGITDFATYAAGLSGRINELALSPARRFRGPAGMSHQAPLVDAATSVDPTNQANNFISYYTYGAALGLALDLEIRKRFPGKSLDDMMAMMWQRHGKNEASYIGADLRAALGEVTGDPDFVREWFQRQVDLAAAPDFEVLLAAAGILVRPARPDAAWIGNLGLVAGDGGLVVQGNTIIDTPVYRAGVERGDTLISLGGTVLSDPSDLGSALEASQPGQTLELVYSSRGEVINAVIVTEADPVIETIPFEAAGLPVTAEIQRFRESWLGSKSRVPSGMSRPSIQGG